MVVLVSACTRRRLFCVQWLHANTMANHWDLFSNFEWPFILRIRLQSLRKLAETRFRWFPIFHCATFFFSFHAPFRSKKKFPWKFCKIVGSCRESDLKMRLCVKVSSRHVYHEVCRLKQIWKIVSGGPCAYSNNWHRHNDLHWLYNLMNWHFKFQSLLDRFYVVLVDYILTFTYSGTLRKRFLLRNFERPFTPCNTANTRFRRLSMFHFSKHFWAKKQFLVSFVRLLQSSGRMDFKIKFGVKLCFRYTHPEVCVGPRIMQMFLLGQMLVKKLDGQLVAHFAAMGTRELKGPEKLEK